MFVCSLKGKSLKLACFAVAAFFAIAGAVFLLPDYDSESTAYVSADGNETISFKGIKTEEDRLEFIHSFGIEVDPVPIEEYKTKVPKNFDAVYNEYNIIQKAQGLNLEKYKGKKITRYTYKMINYPNSNEVGAKVYLNIIQYKDRVIAGDISSSDMGGFVRTFCDFKRQ